jgi:hypothetical protein
MTGKLGELLGGSDRTLKLVWVAMSGALLIYAGLPFVVPIDQEPSVSILILAAVAAAAAIVAITYRRLQFSDAALAKNLSRPVPSMEAIAERIPEGEVRTQLMRNLESLTSEERRVYGTVAAMQMPYIVVWALNESVGIFGLVGAFMGYEVSVVLPFIGVALALQIACFPRIPELAERVQRLALTTPVTESGSR